MIFKSIKFVQEVRERTYKTSVTRRREKVPLKGLEYVKLLATLDVLNPRPQEGLNKIFSSKFKQPKVLQNGRLHIYRDLREKKPREIDWAARQISIREDSRNSPKQNSLTPGIEAGTEVNLSKHVNVILVRFDEEVPKEEKVMIIQEKSCVEKERRSSESLNSKVLEPSKEKKNEKPMTAEYKLKIQYPVALVHDCSQDNMGKFIEIFKQLKINLPLCDILLQETSPNRDDVVILEMLLAPRTDLKRIHNVGKHETWLKIPKRRKIGVQAEPYQKPTADGRSNLPHAAGPMMKFSSWTEAYSGRDNLLLRRLLRSTSTTSTTSEDSGNSGGSSLRQIAGFIGITATFNTRGRRPSVLCGIFVLLSRVFSSFLMAPKQSIASSSKSKRAQVDDSIPDPTSSSIPPYLERLFATAQKWIANREHLKLIIEKSFDAPVITLRIRCSFGGLERDLFYIFLEPITPSLSVNSMPICFQEGQGPFYYNFHCQEGKDSIR
ncbi:hypothetical protein M9H77_26673 [Catharanthus roseus]|uniref:Uncharacterized protein n=1 Tax=Catharanthus roseus TaxID=4058 RepID=A0ACC0AAL2_CATRO|nr:hypothetical protein M9H77_26673 [Catharanthus roseus]